ncbi:MFS transporter [Hyphomonas sp.]|uniref:spinster family MFS transporter n=1 Tax=Hyphomonas sp. TaxID=87 RepID=UPI0032EBE595
MSSDVAESSAPASAGDEELETKSWYKHYTLIVLGLVYASSFMDRQITAILIDDLKAEFALSDTQLGLLSGLAFALFYATLGIPIARLADRSNRVKIISVSIAIWGFMTVISGAAQNFLQLLLARVGVGVGEAGSSPPSHSIISDYYSPTARSLALSIWSLGAVVGAMIGLIGGGYITENFGWRWAYFVAGAQSLIVVPIVYFTVREPKRGQQEKVAPQTETEKKKDAGEATSTFAIIGELLRNRNYTYATFSHVMAGFFTFGLGAWMPAYFMREFELSPTEVGALVSVMLLFGSVTGMLAGGWLATHLAKRDIAWEAWVPAVALGLAAPAFALALTTNVLVLSAIGMGAAQFLVMAHHGPGLALVQSAVPANRRAMAAALMYFCSNMLGLGLGPLIIGFISDLGLAGSIGGNLRVGLSIAILPLAVGALGYWRLGYRWRARPST